MNPQAFRHSPRLLQLGALLASAASLSAAAGAQEPPRPSNPGALLAVETLRNQVLDHSFDRLVEISGKGGNPIPRAWTVTAHDPRSPSTLTEYVVRGRKVEPRGETNTFYPKNPPEGFFQPGRVTVDSEQAFLTADKEAGLAKVGFDSLDFRLRALEFTADAVWTVRLRNAEEELVGNVDISAQSGKVLRTVWYFRDPATGGMRIADSALTGNHSAFPESPGLPPSTLPPSGPPIGASPPGASPGPPPAPVPPPPEPLPPVPLDPSDQPKPEPLPIPEPNTPAEPRPLPVPVPGESAKPSPAPVPPRGESRPSRPGPAAPVPQAPAPR